MVSGLYIDVTVHGNRFLCKSPTRRTNYPNLFYYKTLHVSGIFSAHHLEFSTVHSALVSFASKQSQDGTQFHHSTASVVWWLACWPLVPEFAGWIPTEAVGFFLM
jgi:hypothetical protein